MRLGGFGKMQESCSNVQCLSRSQKACCMILCRCNAARIVLLAPDEWQRGTVRVKNQADRSESEISLAKLC